jgi:hypothetical protein
MSDLNVVWDGTDGAGCEVAPGSYFLVVEERAGKATKKIVVIR